MWRAEMFVDKRPQKKIFFDELACDSVIEETRLFQNFTTVVQKFKVLDLKFFLQKSFNECEETLSELTDMYESDTEKEDLLSKLKSFCQLFQADAARSVISDVHIICNVEHFLRNLRNERNVSKLANERNVSKLANIYRIYSVLPASAERSFSRLK